MKRPARVWTYLRRMMLRWKFYDCPGDNEGGGGVQFNGDDCDESLAEEIKRQAEEIKQLKEKIKKVEGK